MLQAISRYHTYSSKHVAPVLSVIAQQLLEYSQVHLGMGNRDVRRTCLHMRCGETVNDDECNDNRNRYKNWGQWFTWCLGLRIFQQCFATVHSHPIPESNSSVRGKAILIQIILCACVFINNWCSRCNVDKLMTCVKLHAASTMSLAIATRWHTDRHCVTRHLSYLTL